MKIWTIPVMKEAIMCYFQIISFYFQIISFTVSNGKWTQRRMLVSTVLCQKAMKVKPVALAVIELHLSGLRHHLVSQLVSRSVGWSVSWSVGQSVGRSVGRSVGQSVSYFLSRKKFCSDLLKTFRGFGSIYRYKL